MRKLLAGLIFLSAAWASDIRQPENIIYVTNEGATGTAVNRLAKLTGAPSTAILPLIVDTGGVVGICIANCGITGVAIIQIHGQANCAFDSATTAGHYVQIDNSTTGDCMDAGAGFPAAGQVIGRVLSTNGGAGTYQVDLFPSEIQASAGAAHNLLSATHLDTTVNAVLRGSIITGQGVAPTWARLAVGLAGRFLRSDGNDIGYSAGAASGTGACGAGSFVNGLNDDAAPTCAVPAGTGYATIDDEGGALVQRAIVNFIGAGVTCIDNPGSVRTDCTIPGAAPGAGILDINALNPASQFLATGAAGADFNIASAVATHTFNLPDAGPGARGAVTTAAQTFAGTKTFTPTKAVSGLNVGAFAGDPAGPVNGDILYNSATNKFRCYENAGWANCIGAGGAGSTTTQGLYSALPGACAAGDQYWPTDSPYKMLCSPANTWNYYAYGYAATVPVSGTFAWINQNTATVTTTGGPMYLNSPSAAGQLNILKKAAPGTPYTVTVMYNNNSSNMGNPITGIILRNSGTGKIVYWGLRVANASHYHVLMQYTDATNFSNWAYNQQRFGPAGSSLNLTWLRVNDDGKNRNYSWSTDGINWQQMYTELNDAFTTTDEIGVAVNPDGATFGVGMTVLSWIVN